MLVGFADLCMDRLIDRYIFIYIYNRRKESKKETGVWYPSTFFFALLWINQSISVLCVTQVTWAYTFFLMKSSQKHRFRWDAWLLPDPTPILFVVLLNPAAASVMQTSSTSIAVYITARSSSGALEFRRNHSTTSVTQELFMPSSLAEGHLKEQAVSRWLYKINNLIE